MKASDQLRPLRTFVIAMASEADAVRPHLRPGDRLIVSGIGKVNAAAATQRAIFEGATDVWNVGVAGSVNPSMHVGDCFAIDRAVEYDFDLSLVNGTSVGVHDERTSPYFACVLDGLDDLPRTTLATADRFVDTEEDLQTIRSLGASLRDMEGAAVAHVCELNDVPCHVVKSVSDVHGHGSTTEQYRVNLRKALSACAAAIQALNR